MALIKACEKGKLGVVKRIISRHPEDVNQCYRGDITPVMSAAFNARTAVFKYLFRHGANLTAVDGDGKNALHFACLRAATRIMKYILTLGNPGIESKGNKGVTPVMYAADACQEESVKFLLNHRCNFTARNDDGHNVLHFACMFCPEHFVQFILSKHPFDIDLRDNMSKTPIYLALYAAACFETGLEAVKLLVRKGCDMNIVLFNGNNILHFTAENCTFKAVKYVFSIANYNINARGKDGNTALHYSAIQGKKDMFDFLFSKGANATTVNNNGENVLHLACVCRHYKLAKYIASLGITDMKQKDVKGRTPLRYTPPSVRRKLSKIKNSNAS